MHVCTVLLRSVASVLALFLIVPVWVALAFGRVRLQGYEEAKAAVVKGRILMLANHPSLIETIVLPALFWHWQWLGLAHRIPWSLADERLFGSRGLWLYTGFRCIPVRRTDATVTSFRGTVRALKQRFSIGGSVIGYPEGGRTCKGSAFVEWHGRRVRVCNPNLFLAASTEVDTVVPVWVKHGESSYPESMVFGYMKLFFGPRMLIIFGKPQAFQRELLSPEALAALLLGTGHVTAPILQPAF